MWNIKYFPTLLVITSMYGLSTSGGRKRIERLHGLMQHVLLNWIELQIFFLICIVYLFYCYQTYFNPIFFFLSRSIFFDKENRPPILLLFYFYWNPILQLSSGLFYPCFMIPNHKIARKIDYHLIFGVKFSNTSYK